MTHCFFDRYARLQEVGRQKGVELTLIPSKLAPTVPFSLMLAITVGSLWDKLLYLIASYACKQILHHSRKLLNCTILQYKSTILTKFIRIISLFCCGWHTHLLTSTRFWLLVRAQQLELIEHVEHATDPQMATALANVENKEWSPATYGARATQKWCPIASNVGHGRELGLHIVAGALV